MSVQPAQKLLKQRGTVLYVQLGKALREMIREEGLKPGDPLPTEEQLRATYGVSRSTIRDALSELEREHLIERRQGIGTFVARPPLTRDLRALTSFTEDMRQRGLRPSSLLLAYEQQVINNVPEELAGTPLVRVVRLRLADGIPFGVHDVMIPQKIAQEIGFTQPRLSEDPSLSFYASLEASGYFIEEAREHLTADIATSQQAQLLKVRPGAPLIKAVRLSWTREGEILEFVTAFYLPEHYEYVIKLKR